MMLSMMSYRDGSYSYCHGEQPDIQLHLGGHIFGGDPGGELNDRILRAGNVSQSTVGIPNNWYSTIDNNMRIKITQCYMICPVHYMQEIVI